MEGTTKQNGGTDKKPPAAMMRTKTRRSAPVQISTLLSERRHIKALTKDNALEVVNSPDQAQFFLEYSELSREATVTGSRTKERQQRSQMVVYLINPDQRRVIVWSDNRARETEHFMGMKMYDSGRSESELTKKFLKALKKSRK